MAHVDPDLSAGRPTLGGMATRPPRPSIFWTIVLVIVLVGGLHAIAPALGVAALVVVLALVVGRALARALR